MDWPWGCESCRDWVRLSTVGRFRADTNYGQCHRYAPRPIVNDLTNVPKWPETYKDDFCGEGQMVKKETT